MMMVRKYRFFFLKKRHGAIKYNNIKKTGFLIIIILLMGNKINVTTQVMVT